MSSTGYADATASDSGLAVGYEWMDGDFQAVDHVPKRFGAGGIVSTAQDLAKWDASLDSHSLLKESTVVKMWNPEVLNDGSLPILGWDDMERTLVAGKGWFASTHFGRKIVHHGGNIDGYSAQIDHFIDDRVTVIVLANNEAHAAINIAAAVEQTFVQTLELVSAASLVQQGRLAYRSGDPATASRFFLSAMDKGDKLPSTAYSTARAFAAIGEKEKALFYLEKAARMGYRRIEVVKTDEVFNGLHGDALWSTIIQSIAANDQK
jgi:CubicO group peptidase (beta-lactamase class C family)